MPRNFSKFLSGQSGEALVVAELGRLGIVASSFSGNVPDIDILAYRNGNTTSLQVKSWRSGSVSFDARRFLNITMEGDRQTIHGLNPELGALPIYVLVKLGDKYGTDRFFILDQLQLARVIQAGYQSFLDKHEGVRPRNPSTAHNSVTLDQLLSFENNWDLILASLEGIK